MLYGSKIGFFWTYIFGHRKLSCPVIASCPPSDFVTVQTDADGKPDKSLDAFSDAVARTLTLPRLI
jgi:hypothetical protein